MLESPLELLKPHTIEEQETEVFQNDSLPPVFDTELWESSENPDCTHRPPSSPSQRRATQRASKFFLEPRSRKEGDLDFLKLGEESVPAKRRRLVGSFVSLDAEVRCQGNDEVVVRMCDPYQSNYSSIENADVPPFEDETITLPTAFRPTIQLLGSNNRKGGNGDKLGSDFKPSKGSAFSTSSPQGLRKYGESVK